jgi:hypothetical protein
MENQAPVTPVNQSVGEKVIQTEQQPKKSNFLVILLSILLFISVVIAGFFVLQTQKLTEELITKEDKSGGDTATVEITLPTTSPVSVNKNWKKYTNSDFSYQYPEEWTEGQSGQTIVSNQAGANITNFTKDMPMYNECMKLEITNITNDLLVKYYSYDLGTEMCSNQANMNNKEAWITKVDGDGFQPGLIYDYNEVIYPNSLKVFDQILSTFKFTN